MFLWDRRPKAFTIDDEIDMEIPLVSDNITKRAREMAEVPESESPPAAAIAFKVCLHPYL